jgi:hypothetical protein
MGLNRDKALLAAEAVDSAKVVGLLRALVRIPSHYPGPGEEGVVAFLEAYLGERGFKPLRQEAAPGCPNLVADLGEGEGGLILEGHTDVVTSGNEGLWRYPPYGAVVEGGRLYVRPGGLRHEGGPGRPRRSHAGGEAGLRPAPSPPAPGRPGRRGGDDAGGEGLRAGGAPPWLPRGFGGRARGRGSYSQGEHIWKGGERC